LQDVAATLDAAVGNFARVCPEPVTLFGALLVTQTAREQVFEALASAGRAGEWQIAGVPDEPETLLASQGRKAVALIRGRQVRADDGLEVAALGTCREFCDGRPFAETLVEVVESGAVAVIPWGFGKWTGRRGQLVDDVMTRMHRTPVFLGDSGARAGFLGEPALIRRGRLRGMRVIAGTDPFPFAGDFRRVGGFGFLADVDPDPAAPWGSLRAWLMNSQSTPHVYGSPSNPIRFLINQLGVQVYNRLPGGA
jgi:hypothetical protein